MKSFDQVQEDLAETTKSEMFQEVKERSLARSERQVKSCTKKRLDLIKDQFNQKAKLRVTPESEERHLLQSWVAQNKKLFKSADYDLWRAKNQVKQWKNAKEEDYRPEFLKRLWENEQKFKALKNK